MINKIELIIILIIVILLGLQIYNFIKKRESKYSTYVLYIPERYEYIKKELDKTTLNPIFIEGYDKDGDKQINWAEFKAAIEEISK